MLPTLPFLYAVPLAYGSLPCHTPKPVSYTHLDVYKRQSYFYVQAVNRDTPVVLYYWDVLAPILLGLISKRKTVLINKTGTYNWSGR